MYEISWFDLQNGHKINQLRCVFTRLSIAGDLAFISNIREATYKIAKIKKIYLVCDFMHSISYYQLSH
jgi:hypothetical protein